MVEVFQGQAQILIDGQIYSVQPESEAFIIETCAYGQVVNYEVGNEREMVNDVKSPCRSCTRENSIEKPASSAMLPRLYLL